MSDWFESLKVFVSERIGNPIIFAYAFAWLFVNYHIVIMVLSDADYMEKISFIPAEYADWQDRVYYLGVPLVVALIYSLGSPWLKHLIMMYDFWQSKFTRALQLRHVNATLISTAEREELISKHQEQIDRMREEMLRRATYYSDLSHEKDGLVKAVSSLEKEVSALTSDKEILKAAEADRVKELVAAKEEVAALKRIAHESEQYKKSLNIAVPILQDFLDSPQSTKAWKGMSVFQVVDRKNKIQTIVNSLKDGIMD